VRWALPPYTRERLEEGLHRIGLNVVADNKRARGPPVSKMGFKIEGVMKDAYFGEDGKYHDMLIMGLLLN